MTNGGGAITSISGFLYQSDIALLKVLEKLQDNIVDNEELKKWQIEVEEDEDGTGDDFSFWYDGKCKEFYQVKEYNKDDYKEFTDATLKLLIKDLENNESHDADRIFRLCSIKNIDTVDKKKFFDGIFNDNGTTYYSDGGKSGILGKKSLLKKIDYLDSSKFEAAGEKTIKYTKSDFFDDFYSDKTNKFLGKFDYLECEGFNEVDSKIINILDSLSLNTLSSNDIKDDLLVQMKIYIQDKSGKFTGSFDNSNLVLGKDNGKNLLDFKKYIEEFQLNLTADYLKERIKLKIERDFDSLLKDNIFDGRFYRYKTTEEISNKKENLLESIREYFVREYFCDFTDDKLFYLLSKVNIEKSNEISEIRLISGSIGSNEYDKFISLYSKENLEKLIANFLIMYLSNGTFDLHNRFITGLPYLPLNNPDNYKKIKKISENIITFKKNIDKNKISIDGDIKGKLSEIIFKTYEVDFNLETDENKKKYKQDLKEDLKICCFKCPYNKINSKNDLESDECGTLNCERYNNI